MPLLWAVFLGVLVGYLRGGRIKRLAAVRLRALWLLLPPLLIQLLIFPLGKRDPIITWGTPYWHILSYLFLLALVVLNRRYPEILVMGTGLFLNFLAIVANGGYMPASVEALRQAGMKSSPSPGRGKTLGQHHPHGGGNAFEFPWGLAFSSRLVSPEFGVQPGRR